MWDYQKIPIFYRLLTRRRFPKKVSKTSQKIVYKPAKRKLASTALSSSKPLALSVQANTRLAKLTHSSNKKGTAASALYFRSSM